MDANQLKILQAIEDAMDGEKLTPEEIALVKAEGIDILELTATKDITDASSIKGKTEEVVRRFVESSGSRATRSATRHATNNSFWKRFF